MKVTIDGSEFTIRSEETAEAKKLVGRFLKTVRQRTVPYGHSTFYYAVLLMMFKMSSDLLDKVSPAALAALYNNQPGNLHE